MATKKATRKATKKKSAKKAPARKSIKKSAAKKTAAKKSSKKTTRKYGPTVGKDVEREMLSMKRGKLRSGRSGKKVTSRKQAIAIGLSEARKKGAKVPPRRRASSR